MLLEKAIKIFKESVSVGKDVYMQLKRQKSGSNVSSQQGGEIAVTNMKWKIKKKMLKLASVLIIVLPVQKEQRHNIHSIQ